MFEIAEVLEINYGAISYHLAKLRNAGLVSVERYKLYLYYQLDTQALAAHRDAARTICGVPIPLLLLGGFYCTQFVLIHLFTSQQVSDILFNAVAG